jgi:superfamily II DNA or RNA helicase
VRYALKDYQSDAVASVLRNLEDARDDLRRKGRKIAFSLSAPTGAGKTVMAAAVIEALFEGSDEFDVEPDPSAVVLWVTDDPSLNEQTRHRILESADRLGVSRLRIIGEGGFDQETFEPGNVYFLNIQKLGTATTYVKQSDKRTYTLWQTIQNTIEDPSRTLYLVLDEAHKGMRTPNGRAAEERSRSTIVQRLVNGHEGIPAAPIVWGISATVERFTDAMTAAQAEGRTTLPAVVVDPRAVQESGLLKDVIVLDIPDEHGAFETTMLRSAVQQVREVSSLWAEYSMREGLPDPVLPLLVVQAPNKPSTAELSRMLDLIHDEWPELGDESVANVFGEHETLTLGRHVVPYIPPQDVQAAPHVRVLLAKDAVSTGWDCPRAEVLFSLRPAQDRTHITQLLGRMVRTPLARRIESDERLNAVSCFVPFFDRVTAKKVVSVLTGESVDADDPNSAANKGLGRKALLASVTALWNQNVPEDIKAFLASLPSESTPGLPARPIKRLLGLAAELALDGLVEKPNARAHEALFAVLDGQMAQHRREVDKRTEEIYSAEIRRITSTVAAKEIKETTYREQADDRTVDDAFRAASRALGVAVANGYAKRLAQSGSDADDEFDIHDAKARIAALLSIPGVLEVVETAADNQIDAWLNTERRAISSLSEERQAAYNGIKRQARKPQRIDIVTPQSRIEAIEDEAGNPAPTREKHLLADEQGHFPVGDLNPWEVEVVDIELGDARTIAWYRNPSHAKADALQIPYQMGGKWKSMQPDFIFFSRKQDGSLAASIIDPHGHHLSDALPKLQGLADFAETYGDDFVRIEAISQIDAKDLRMLNLKDPEVRAAVREATTAAGLYESEHANPYA